MVFTRRWINLSIGDQAAFVGGGSTDRLGLRVSARISHAGDAFGAALNSTADVLVYGLELSTMNQYTRAAWPMGSFQQEFHGLNIEAGDEINGFSSVFYGNIIQAWPDFQGAPLVPFHILAQGISTQTASPLSYNGPVSASTVFQKLSGMMGPAVKGFKDLGVTGMIDSPYLSRSGTAWGMAQQLAHATKSGIFIDRGTFLVFPENGQNTGTSPTITPRPGQGDWQMVSYPGVTNRGVLVKSEFYRALDYLNNFTISGSAISVANGSWTAIRIDYDLESNVPKGHWFVTLEGSTSGAPGKHQ